MGVFLAEGKFIADQFETGDIGYAPMGAGHYIRNTGSDILKV
jgi:oxalate decarboxylase